MTQALSTAVEGEYVEAADGVWLHFHSVGDGPLLVRLHRSGPAPPGSAPSRHFKTSYSTWRVLGLFCSIGLGLFGAGLFGFVKAIHDLVKPRTRA